jgi:hypothetical protein
MLVRMEQLLAVLLALQWMYCMHLGKHSAPPIAAEPGKYMHNYSVLRVRAYNPPTSS